MVRGYCRQTVGRPRSLLPITLIAVLASICCSVLADSFSSDPVGSSVLTSQERAQVASVPYSNAPLINRTNKFDTRFDRVSNQSWREIFQNPEVVSLYLEQVPGDGSRQVTVGDVNAVFPVQAKYFFRALIDYSSYPRVSPRTVFDAERSSRSGPFQYHKRVQKVSAQFLGFGQTYLFVTNNYETRLGKDQYGLKWNLEKSLDNKFFSLTGSWYIEGMNCDGTPCSYVRYFNRTGLNSAPPVPAPILRYVTATSYKNMMIQFFNKAVRLEAADRRD